MTAMRREQEIQELRRVIASKERGIDSLRETLSCTKRSLETRVRQLEDALRNREHQVRTKDSHFYLFTMLISSHINIAVASNRQ
jgi:hypothetical protein